MAQAPRPMSSCSNRSQPGALREVSKTLTAERRDKLLALQRREKMKEVLISKFRKTNDCSESVINKEVSNFCKKAKVTEANLNRLERRIRKHVKVEKGEKEGDEYDENSDNETAADDLVSNYSMPSMAPSQVSRTSSLAEMLNRGKIPDDYDWSRLDEYAMFLHGEDAHRQKVVDKEMKNKLKSYLDVQVAEREQRKTTRKAEEQRYYDNLLLELEDWEINERAKQEELKDKMVAEKKSRDIQLEYDRKLKEEESLRKKEEDERVAQQIELELAEEKERAARKKEEAKQAILKVFQENMEDKKLRDEESERQRATDLADQVERERRMEQDEAKRQEELTERDARQKALIEKMKTEVQTAQKAQGQEDAIRAKKQRDEQEQTARALDIEKKKRLGDLRYQTQDFLFMQMAEKDHKKQGALELKEIQASVLQRDAKEYQEVEAEKVVQRRLRNLENRAQLEDQIRDKQSRKSKLMSDSEISMNLELINVVEKTLKERDERCPTQAC